MHILAAQPKSMGGGVIVSQVLWHMAGRGEGNTFLTTVSLILIIFAHSRRVCWSIHCQEA